MRVICRNASKLLSACRQPLSSSKWDSYTVSQLCRSKDSVSLGKLNVVDCLVNKTDVPLSSLQSSNIFLKPQVVFYDGVCHLCNSGVNWVIRADTGKRISFCAVQSEVAEPYLLLCGLTREDVLDRFLFVEGPGQYSQASTGVLLVIPAPLRDAIYDFVARRRYKWFGRADSCILPKEDVLDHFIDREEIIAKLREKMED